MSEVNKETLQTLGAGLFQVGPGQVAIIEEYCGTTRKWVVLGVGDEHLDLDAAELMECVGIDLDKQSTGHEFLGHEALQKLAGLEDNS